MTQPLVASGLFKLLDGDHDQLVCDEFKDLGGVYTKETVLAALDHLYDRTVMQTLSAIAAVGSVTITETRWNCKPGEINRQMSDDWINTLEKRSQMSLSLQETGILAQLKEVQANAVIAGHGPAKTHGWSEETREAVNAISNEVAHQAIKQTLAVFDAEGYFTKVDNSSGEPQVVDILSQEMADEWANAINS